jgi:hypothetical protein
VVVVAAEILLPRAAACLVVAAVGLPLQAAETVVAVRRAVAHLVVELPLQAAELRLR